MTERPPIVEFAGISKRYDRLTVLNDLNLVVQPDVFTVLYGLPATGKSVLMRILMGLEAPNAGTVRLRGQDVTTWSAADRNIGYVPQSFALYPHISVYDNIAYPLHLAKVPRQESEPVVRQAAAMLKIEDLLEKRPDQLSGGQKQRVAIARGIAKRTDLFVLDDPLAGLDFKLREQLVDDLRQLQQDAGVTFLYTTSDAIEAMTLADSLALLDAGRVVESGLPGQLYLEPVQQRTMALVGFPPANFLPGTLDSSNGQPQCRTALFETRVETRNGAVSGGPVNVGFRPESLHISSNGASPPPGHVQFSARIVLREDLGGEEIVYVESEGRTLAGVDRHHEQRDDLDQQVTVTIRASDLVIFAPTSGLRLGQGAR